MATALKEQAATKPETDSQPQEALQKRLILCIGGKGGVGKTLVCRLLFYFYVCEQVNALGFDADRENPEFYDYHQDAKPTVKTLNFLSVPGMRSLMEQLEQDSPQITLFDMPGASGSATREQFARFDIFNTLKHEVGDYKVTIIAVLNNCFNSIGSLALTMDAFGDRANYVVVLNQMWSVGEKPFERWYRSPHRNRFLELGGIEIALPLLDLEVFDLLHGLGIPFWQQEKLGIADRVLLRSFLNRARAEFDPAATFMGLPPLATPDSVSSAKGKSSRSSSTHSKTAKRSSGKRSSTKKVSAKSEIQPISTTQDSEASVSSTGEATA